MYELKVTTHFAAAHQLKLVALKCENLHGHNWKVEVYLKGDTLNDAGVLMDFGEIKAAVNDIMNDLDHKYLNELDCFKSRNPSSENIANFITHALQEKIIVPGVKISRVTAWESDDACATYYPD
ncbi:MAG: 6-carboxytetrahydropterin synthase QueD [Pseudomonadota bacterium]